VELGLANKTSAKTVSLAASSLLGGIANVRRDNHCVLGETLHFFICGCNNIFFKSVILLIVC